MARHQYGDMQSSDEELLSHSESILTIPNEAGPSSQDHVEPLALVPGTTVINLAVLVLKYHNQLILYFEKD